MDRSEYIRNRMHTLCTVCKISYADTAYSCMCGLFHIPDPDEYHTEHNNPARGTFCFLRNYLAASGFRNIVITALLKDYILQLTQRFGSVSSMEFRQNTCTNPMSEALLCEIIEFSYQYILEL